MEKPQALNEVPKADAWEKTVSSTGEGDSSDQGQTMKKEKEATKSQAAALIDSQRNSVKALTHIRTAVQNLSVEQILDALDLSSSSSTNTKNYVVFDDLLGEELCREMMEESRSMFDNNKMELDLNVGITSGEYAAAIKGGHEQYVDCPRSVEYVVCVTRHLPGNLNKVGEEEGDDSSDLQVKKLDYKLDETASMAGIRAFDRKARLSSLALLAGQEGGKDNDNDNADLVKKPFEYVLNTEGDEVDLRKVTVLYFMTPDGWDEECGGGVTFQDENGEEVKVVAKSDRLLLFSSEGCLHRMDPWTGKDGQEGGSYIVTHLVRQRK